MQSISNSMFYAISSKPKIAFKSNGSPQGSTLFFDETSEVPTGFNSSLKCHNKLKEIVEKSPIDKGVILIGSQYKHSNYELAEIKRFSSKVPDNVVIAMIKTSNEGIDKENWSTRISTKKAGVDYCLIPLPEMLDSLLEQINQ